jgi:K319L-like, PKD domain
LVDPTPQESTSMKRMIIAGLLAAAFVACGRDSNITAPPIASPAASRPTALAAVGTDTTTGARIETNQDDYVPGEFVHVDGSGWAPNETVHLVMTEDPDTHPDVSQDVVADSTGAFSIHFYDVEENDLGVTFTLTATGETSGSVAVAVFTDAVNLKILGADGFQHEAKASEEDLGDVQKGTTLTLACPSSLTISAGGLGGSTTQDWSLAYAGAGADNATLSLAGMTTLTPISGSLTGSSDMDCVKMEIDTDTLTVGKTYEGSLSATGTGAGAGPYWFKFKVVAATPTNSPPTADAGGPYTGYEGHDIALDGTGSTDSDGTITAYAWTYAVVSADLGASCSITNPSAASASITCTDDGSYTVTLTVTDNGGDSDAETVSLTLDNANPVVTINSPLDGALFSLLNGAISVDASYTDAGSNDTHDCQLELDGALDASVPYFPVLGGTCTGSITPPEAGVYKLTVRVKDDDGGVGFATIIFVVYDPSAGFVTGGGWIIAAAGSFPADGSLTGKATFGFVSRYKKGANTPDGNTEFVFHAANFNFHSSNYQWLIVNQNGTNAQFKGTGTVNGAGDYTFMLWATDGTPDKFRIKIWPTGGDPDYPVFDNVLGQDDSATPQGIAGGSIQIQTGGKK